MDDRSCMGIHTAHSTSGRVICGAPRILCSDAGHLDRRCEALDRFASRMEHVDILTAFDVSTDSECVKPSSTKLIHPQASPAAAARPGSASSTTKRLSSAREEPAQPTLMIEGRTDKH